MNAAQSKALRYPRSRAWANPAEAVRYSADRDVPGLGRLRWMLTVNR